jgi:hypothetical protein
MGQAAKVYIYVVIAAGASVLAWRWSNRKPLGAVWQLCNFWSLPYYLVEAAVAGVMMATWRMSDWPPSLLVLPLMGLMYISYRVHVRQAVDRIEIPA